MRQFVHTTHIVSLIITSALFQYNGLRYDVNGRKSFHHSQVIPFHSKAKVDQSLEESILWLRAFPY